MFGDDFVCGATDSAYQIEGKKEILHLEPILKKAVWGGTRLKEEFGYQVDSDTVGECWGISAHPNGDCVVKNGTYKGMTLSRLYREKRELFGDCKEEEFPLLVKLIDTKMDSSIQVHPNDSYARDVEGVPFGKTECWYIIDCHEDAALVIGHHAKDKEELKKMIGDGKYEELIRFVPVQKGDLIQIDPGTIHAVKGGFLILETQQNSDITYRVYDYNRMEDGKLRPLHVEQSLDVINVPDECYKTAIHKVTKAGSNALVELVDCPSYTVWKLDVKGRYVLEQNEKFLNISIIAGSGMLEGCPVQKGDHMIIPSGYGALELDGEMELILSTVKEAK